jgi:hypothetical protein
MALTLMISALSPLAEEIHVPADGSYVFSERTKALERCGR